MSEIADSSRAGWVEHVVCAHRTLLLAMGKVHCLTLRASSTSRAYVAALQLLVFVLRCRV